jgi:hypothetical protein
VAESLAISTVDVASTAGGAGTTAVSEADKARTSTVLTTKDEGGDFCTVACCRRQTRRRARWEVHGRRTTCTGALTLAPCGRRRSSPTAVMWKSSRRRHARLGACCR